MDKVSIMLHSGNKLLSGQEVEDLLNNLQIPCKREGGHFVEVGYENLPFIKKETGFTILNNKGTQISDSKIEEIENELRNMILDYEEDLKMSPEEQMAWNHQIENRSMRNSDD